MNYYQFHIGDFRSGTINMSRHSRWIYRDMMDVYYDSEEPLPLDMDVLCDMLGVSSDDEKEIVRRHLRFKFDMTDSGYTHEVCEKVISEYRAKADVARANGKLGGRPKGKQNKPSGYQLGYEEVSYCEQDGTGSQTNHKPLTTNQEPEESKALVNDESSTPAGKPSRKEDPVPYDLIIESYRKCLPELPQPESMTPKRKAGARSIWKQYKKSHEPDFWDRYFTYVGKQEFLCNMRGIGINWLLNFENMCKVIEGNYE